MSLPGINRRRLSFEKVNPTERPERKRNVYCKALFSFQTRANFLAMMKGHTEASSQFGQGNNQFGLRFSVDPIAKRAIASFQFSNSDRKLARLSRSAWNKEIREACAKVQKGTRIGLVSGIIKLESRSDFYRNSLARHNDLTESTYGSGHTAREEATERHTRSKERWLL